MSMSTVQRLDISDDLSQASENTVRFLLSLIRSFFLCVREKRAAKQHDSLKCVV